MPSRRDLNPRSAEVPNFACGTSVRTNAHTNPEQELLVFIPTRMATPEVCPVCLEPITRLATINNCEHKFCRPCITEWCKNSTSCPLCRAEITVIKDPVTGVATQVTPVVQHSDHVHDWIPSFEVFAQQRRLPHTTPAPDPDYVVYIHGSNSESSSGSNSRDHPSGSVNYSDSSSASSSSSNESDQSESSDGSYISNDRDYSPKPRRRN